jgi:hypothetical protein
MAAGAPQSKDLSRAATAHPVGADDEDGNWTPPTSAVGRRVPGLGHGSRTPSPDRSSRGHGGPAVAAGAVPVVGTVLPPPLGVAATARTKKAPRFAISHPDSDGASDDDFGDAAAAGCPLSVFRKLRPDEVTALPDGGATLGNDGTLTVCATAKVKLPGSHIQAGSHAKTRSNWVSASESLRVAAAWAARDCATTGGAACPFVVEARLPAGRPAVHLKSVTTGSKRVEKETLAAINKAGGLMLPSVVVPRFPEKARYHDGSGTIDALFNLGVLGRHALASSREVLVGGEPGAAVVARRDIVRLGRVTGLPNLEAFKRERSRHEGDARYTFAKARAKVAEGVRYCMIDWGVTPGPTYAVAAVTTAADPAIPTRVVAAAAGADATRLAAAAAVADAPAMAAGAADVAGSPLVPGRAPQAQPTASQHGTPTKADGKTWTCEHCGKTLAEGTRRSKHEATKSCAAAREAKNK